ncbi:MAG TPA: STAS domain-containing protein [Anaeromyxobacter sp.]|nr:STAS domain-containing protein [Anaeromyxobacter sp.]
MPPGHTAPKVGGAVLLELEETLDQHAADQLMEHLEEAPPAERLILDFSGVRSVDYAALAHLVSALLDEGVGRILLRGLCAQHWRVLRYLGLDASCRDGRDRVVERYRADVTSTDPIH